MKPSLRQEIRHLLAMGYEQRGQEWVPIPFYRGLWQWLARKKMETQDCRTGGANPQTNNGRMRPQASQAATALTSLPRLISHPNRSHGTCITVPGRHPCHTNLSVRLCVISCVPC